MDEQKEMTVRDVASDLIEEMGSDVASDLPTRDELRAMVLSKFPDLPVEAADWVADVSDELIRKDADAYNQLFRKEVERGLRAGEENAIQFALAVMRYMEG